MTELSTGIDSSLSEFFNTPAFGECVEMVGSQPTFKPDLLERGDLIVDFTKGGSSLNAGGFVRVHSAVDVSSDF